MDVEVEKHLTEAGEAHREGGADDKALVEQTSQI